MAPEQITALVAIGEPEMLEFKQSIGTCRAPTTTLTSPGRNGTILILKGTHCPEFSCFHTRPNSLFLS